jgi:Domain of unknown function (DUF2760)
MDMMILGLILGVLVSMAFAVALTIARAGGLKRAWWGLTVAGRGQQDPALAAKIDSLLANPAAPVPTSPPPVSPPPPAVSKPTVPPPPPKPTGEPLRLLNLLQAESRLVDFLMEDVSAASDAQIGQGVREVHKKASAALKKYLVFESVLGGTEGDTVTVQKGFDPSAVRVLGNVTGEPPYSGELQHPGWRVKELKLPTTAEGQDPFVVQPAEVQL